MSEMENEDEDVLEDKRDGIHSGRESRGRGAPVIL